MLTNDDTKKNIVSLMNKLLNKLDRVYTSKKGYEVLFNYIRFTLKEEFQQTDIEYKSNNCRKHRNIPNKFWIMWWQGVDHAPSLIKCNIKRLQNVFGKENVVIITQSNYDKYTSISNVIINKFNKGYISVTSLSDIIRFNILKKYGGFWIDSTVTLSDRFLNYFNKIEKKDFFSICNKNQNYHNISHSRWTIWFIGGVPNYDLFDYLDKFYEIYYAHHIKSIDYFLTDDIISYYYLKNPNFRIQCRNLAKTWYPYYILSNFDKIFSLDYIYKFNNQLEYSIQKLTYKFDKKILNNKKSVLYQLCIKKWNFNNKDENI